MKYSDDSQPFESHIWLNDFEPLRADTDLTLRLLAVGASGHGVVVFRGTYLEARKMHPHLFPADPKASSSATLDPINVAVKLVNFPTHLDTVLSKPENDRSLRKEDFVLNKEQADALFERELDEHRGVVPVDSAVLGLATELQALSRLCYSAECFDRIGVVRPVAAIVAFDCARWNPASWQTVPFGELQYLREQHKLCEHRKKLILEMGEKRRASASLSSDVSKTLSPKLEIQSLLQLQSEKRALKGRSPYERFPPEASADILAGIPLSAVRGIVYELCEGGSLQDLFDKLRTDKSLRKREEDVTSSLVVDELDKRSKNSEKGLGKEKEKEKSLPPLLRQKDPTLTPKLHHEVSLLLSDLDDETNRFAKSKYHSQSKSKPSGDEETELERRARVKKMLDDAFTDTTDPDSDELIDFSNASQGISRSNSNSLLDEPSPDSPKVVTLHLSKGAKGKENLKTGKDLVSNVENDVVNIWQLEVPALFRQLSDKNPKKSRLGQLLDKEEEEEEDDRLETGLSISESEQEENLFEDEFLRQVHQDLETSEVLHPRMPNARHHPELYLHSWDHWARVFHSLTRSLSWVHDRGVVWRDVKPGNVLFCKVWGDFPQVKIHDFGAAQIVRHFEAAYSPPLELVGTPQYMAPEMTSHRPYGSIDVFGLGLMALEAETVTAPHSALSEVDPLTALPAFGYVTADTTNAAVKFQTHLKNNIASCQEFVDKVVEVFETMRSEEQTIPSKRAFVDDHIGWTQYLLKNMLHCGGFLDLDILGNPKPPSTCQDVFAPRIPSYVDGNGSSIGRNAVILTSLAPAYPNCRLPAATAALAYQKLLLCKDISLSSTALFSPQNCWRRRSSFLSETWLAAQVHVSLLNDSIELHKVDKDVTRQRPLRNTEIKPRKFETRPNDSCFEITTPDIKQPLELCFTNTELASSWFQDLQLILGCTSPG